MIAAPSRCAVFDLDGTLVDSRLDIANSVNMTRKAFQLPPLPLEKIVSFIGRGVRYMLERSLENTGIEPEEAMETMLEAYRSNLNLNSTLYPGVFQGLHLLRAGGWKIALLSNKPEDFCKFILHDFGIASCFDLILGDSGGMPLKPDPAGLNFILDTLRIPSPEHSWITGDGVNDLQTGRSAGVKRIFAAYGFGNTGNETPDKTAHSFPEIVKILS